MTAWEGLFSCHSEERSDEESPLSMLFVALESALIGRVTAKSDFIFYLTTSADAFAYPCPVQSFALPQVRGKVRSTEFPRAEDVKIQGVDRRSMRGETFAGTDKG